MTPAARALADRAGWLAGTLILLYVIIGSGASASGYHFTEDYGILLIREGMLSDQGFFGSVWSFMERDYHRLRIVYPIRGALIAIFGEDIRLIRMVFAGMSCLTFTGFWHWWRSRKLSGPEAALLTLLTLMGPQMVVWWRMELHENLGMLFLALSLWAIAGLDGRRSWSPRESLWAVLTLLMSFSKENFIVIVPAMVFFKLWQDTIRLDIRFLAAVRRSLAAVSVIIVIFSVQSALTYLRSRSVLFYMEYDGVRWNNILRALRQMTDHGTRELVCAAGAACLLGRLVPAVRRPEAGRILYPAGFLALFLTPAVLLIQSSGVIAPHYLFPAAFAWSCLFAWLYGHVRSSLGPFFRLLLLGALLIVVSLRVGSAWGWARDFAREGDVSTRLVAAVSRATRPDSKILMVLDPARHLEWSYASRIYLDRFGGRANLYLYPILRKRYTPWEKYLIEKSEYSPLREYAGRWFLRPTGPADYDAVVLFPYTELFFRIRTREWFDPSGYDWQVIGDFVVFTRKLGTALEDADGDNTRRVP